MQGDITIEGASKGLEINLTGALVWRGGNPINPQIKMNGHPLHRVGVLRAPIISGSRKPEDWPPNFTHDGPVHTRWEDKEPLPTIATIRIALAPGGDNAWLAFVGIAGIVHAPGGDALDLAGFLAAYDAAFSSDNLTYAKAVLKKAIIATVGEEWLDGKTWEQVWVAVRDWMAAKTMAQLSGQRTVIVEEYGDE